MLNMTFIERLQRELYALTEVAKTLTLPLELPELLNAVMQKIIGVIEPAEVVDVMLWDQSSGLFRSSAVFGYDLGVLVELRLRPGESVTGKVFMVGSHTDRNLKPLLRLLTESGLDVCESFSPYPLTECR